MPVTDIGARLVEAIGRSRGPGAIDRICRACVDVLDIDAAAVSLVFHGRPAGTVGSSSVHARACDEVQFTVGEGPCLESVRTRRPVLIDDLGDVGEPRWPAYRSAMLELGMSAVFAVPLLVAGSHVGALDLFRQRPGPLGTEPLRGALLAAQVLQLPLLDLAAAPGGAEPGVEDAAWEGDATWAEIHALNRVEVAQATGMLVGQLDVDAVEALVRLRAHAYLTGRSASAVAHDILDGTVRLERDAGPRP